MTTIITCTTEKNRATMTGKIVVRFPNPLAPKASEVGNLTRKIVTHVFPQLTPAHLVTSFRNDDDGIHWLPESILHVSEVTDDQV